MEQGTTDALYGKPAHPYTRGLLDSVPVPDPDIQATRLASPLPGELPSPLAPPRGLRLQHPLPARPRRLPGPDAGLGAHRPADQQVARHRWRAAPGRASAEPKPAASLPVLAALPDCAGAENGASFLCASRAGNAYPPAPMQTEPTPSSERQPSQRPLRDSRQAGPPGPLAWSARATRSFR